MASTTDDPPRVFDVPADWPFPRLGRKVVPDGARVDADSDAAAWTAFDTDRRDLERFGAALSRRADGLWRLRLDGRIVTAPGTARTVPAVLRDLALGVRAGAPLRRVGEGSGELVTRVVVAADGRVLGEVDDTRTTTPDGTVTRRVEVVAVDADFGARVHDRLVRAGAVARRTAPPPPATVGEAVHAYLREQRAAILAGDVRLRRRTLPDTASGAVDAGAAIHPTRVAVRRLRSVLRVVTVTDADRAAALDAELSWLSGVLGEVRDLQVLREHLAASLARAADDLGPDLLAAAERAVTAALDERTELAWSRLAGALRGRRYLALLRELAAWEDEPPFTDDARRKPARLRAYAERASRTERTRRRRADDAESRHRARKAAKRARYVNEFAAAAVPSGAGELRRAGARSKKHQTRLGDRQDAALAAEFLARVGRAADGAAAFGCGLLCAAERRAAAG